MADTRIYMATWTFHPIVGGMESHVYILSKALTTAKIPVHIISGRFQDSPIHEIMEGIELTRLRELSPSTRSRISTYGLLSKLLRILRDEKSIIHVHGFHTSLRFSWIASEIGRKIGASVATVHSTVSDPKTELVSRFCLNTFPWGRIIAVSNYCARWVKHLGVVKSKVVTIPNGVDTKQFHPEVKRERIRQLFELSDEPLILCPSRIEPQKGLEYLMDSLPPLLKRIPNVKLLIAGDGTPFTKYSARNRKGLLLRASRLGVRDSIIVHHFPYLEMPQVYAAADVVVLPTLNEGFGMALVEAMASGKPVVATRTGAVPEVVGEGAILVEPKSVEQISSVILRVLSSEKLASSLATAGRERAVRLFDIELMAEKVRQVYSELLSGD